MTYAYDARNRLTSVTDISGATTNYIYNDNGDRVIQTTDTTYTTYLVDDDNPTGYSQVLEEWNIGATSEMIAYEIGSTVLSQTVINADSGNGTQYLMPDGHGSTRQLTSYTSSSSTNGHVVAREDYDAFGNSIALSGAPANIANTVILYVGQQWDPGPQMYDDRAREYDPRIGRFNSFDGINIAPGDVANSNKYLYAGGNPITYDDPSGHDETLAETEGAVGIGALLLTLGIGGALYASTHAAASVRAISAATNEISDLLSSGEAALVHEGAILASNTQAVVAAIARAEAAAGALALAAWKSSATIPPIFPIIRSAGPAIYNFDVASLAANPAWFVLNYNGPLSPVTAANRLWVAGRWGFLRAGAPATSQLDEFPYASTVQGGPPFALGAMVPAWQNLVQGGLLSAFYRYSLKGTPLRPFLVVPVPL